MARAVQRIHEGHIRINGRIRRDQIYVFRLLAVIRLAVRLRVVARVRFIPIPAVYGFAFILPFRRTYRGKIADDECQIRAAFRRRIAAERAAGAVECSP